MGAHSSSRYRRCKVNVSSITLSFAIKQSIKRAIIIIVLFDMLFHHEQKLGRGYWLLLTQINGSM